MRYLNTDNKIVPKFMMQLPVGYFSMQVFFLKDRSSAKRRHLGISVLIVPSSLLHTFLLSRVDEDENEEMEPVKETPLRQLLDAASRHGGGGKKGGAPSLHSLSYGELIKIGKQAKLTSKLEE
jgi:hypothetical protein